MQVNPDFKTKNAGKKELFHKFPFEIISAVGKMYVYISIIVGIYGKAKGQFHRVAMCVQAISDAQALMSNITSIGEDLSDDFVTRVEQAIKDRQSVRNRETVVMKQKGLDVVFEVEKIDLACTTRTVNVMKYYTENKRALAGFQDTVSQSLPTGSLYEKILLWPGPKVSSSDFIRHAKGTSTEKVLTLFTNLQSDGLGEVETHKPSRGGRSWYRFVKKSTEGLSLEECTRLTTSLAKYNVNLAEYEVSIDSDPPAPKKKKVENKQTSQARQPLQSMDVDVNTPHISDVQNKQPNQPGQPMQPMDIDENTPHISTIQNREPMDDKTENKENISKD